MSFPRLNFSQFSRSSCGSRDQLRHAVCHLELTQSIDSPLVAPRLISVIACFRHLCGVRLAQRTGSTFVISAAGGKPGFRTPATSYVVLPSEICGQENMVRSVRHCDCIRARVEGTGKDAR